MNKKFNLNPDNLVRTEKIDYNDEIFILFKLHKPDEMPHHYPSSSYVIVAQLQTSAGELGGKYSEIAITGNKDWIEKKCNELAERVIGQYHMDDEVTFIDENTAPGKFSGAIKRLKDRF